MSEVDISVIVLTLNEERHIARALRSVRFAKQIFVIDSGSTDATVSIARSLNAQVLHHAWVSHADQFQWALDNAPISTEWIMRLDADEVVHSDLANTISERLPRLGPDVVGIELSRRHVFMERWIKHGGRYPLRLLRIFRRGFGRVEQRWMDEHIVVRGGRTIPFDGGFEDHNLHDLSFFTAKHNRYATLEALEVLNQRLKLWPEDRGVMTAGATTQARVRRWAKERIYNRIPFPLASTSYFLYRYLWQRGFLDGLEGLVYHSLQGFWYRFLVGSKVHELERALAGISDKTEIVRVLSRLTGVSLPLAAAIAESPSPE